jgi:hypothetical protein
VEAGDGSDRQLQHRRMKATRMMSWEPLLGTGIRGISWLQVGHDGRGSVRGCPDTTDCINDRSRRGFTPACTPVLEPAGRAGWWRPAMTASGRRPACSRERPECPWASTPVPGDGASHQPVLAWRPYPTRGTVRPAALPMAPSARMPEAAGVGRTGAAIEESRQSPASAPTGRACLARHGPERPPSVPVGRAAEFGRNKGADQHHQAIAFR